MSPIAVYVWRILHDEETVASGVEFESFGIDTNSGEVKVDPSWLREAHDDAPMLPNVQKDSNVLIPPYRVHLYTSPYVHIVHEAMRIPFAGFDVIEAELDFYPYMDRFESKAIPEDALLLVVGELSIDEGTPTVRGTDDTPFLIANCDIHDVRSNLLRRALYYVIFFTGALLLGLAVLPTG
ncbi:hypothetical protein C440_02453 [Haloferax mucosum ATCC BAA-1512]|uniref:Uncharacterized protein n=1 Tax=Haloferax mucosum ATCC BAA-1512 TaxID=662479 RepID=M0IPX2_9EURY|nr:hypothetical protein [Haloferax mucosum]ELZ98072.1 hypothetical protein C440_02453 [Haloferax mucosum ATCC BAA-1512]